MGRRNAVLASLLGAAALLGVAALASTSLAQVQPGYAFESGFGLARKFAEVRELQDLHVSKECRDEDFKIWSEVNRTWHEALKHCADEDDQASPEHWKCKEARQKHAEASSNHQRHDAGDCIADFVQCDTTSSFGDMVFRERKCFHKICEPTNMLKDGLLNAGVITMCTSGEKVCSISVQCVGHEHLCEVYGSNETCPPPKQPEEQNIPAKSSALARTTGHAILLSLLAAAAGWGR